MTEADLAAHTCDWVTPIQKNYRGYTMHEIPPNGQGIAALMALGMLEPLTTWPSLTPDGPDSLPLQIEAMKLAFADIGAYVADGRFMTKVTTEQLLDDAYLKSARNSST